MDQKNRGGLQQGRGSDALITFLVHGFQEKSVIALAQDFREFPGMPIFCKAILQRLQNSSKYR